jgi:hypothetical protein
MGATLAWCRCTYPSAWKLACVNTGELHPRRCADREAFFLIRSQNNLGNRQVEITPAAGLNTVPVTACGVCHSMDAPTWRARTLAGAKASRVPRVRRSGVARTLCVTELGLLVYTSGRGRGARRGSEGLVALVSPLPQRDDPCRLRASAKVVRAAARVNGTFIPTACSLRLSLSKRACDA